MLISAPPDKDYLALVKISLYARFATSVLDYAKKSSKLGVQSSFPSLFPFELGLIVATMDVLHA